MKKYDNYKDSGIEWIGRVPEHWESWKISHAFNRVGSGTTPESGNPIYHENGTISWLNTGDLNDGILESCSKKVTEKALEDYSALKTFPAGSLVMAMYGATIGKTCIIDFETTTNQACCVFCKGNIIDVNFLQYWFIGNKEHIINLAIGGGQPNISQAILKDIRIWCPNMSEQIEQTNYLDNKTNKIDSLIAKKEQFISLLQEERIALINQAVTKGLDSNVNMKDSDIEWLGEIPEHWEVTRLANFGEFFKGRGITKADLTEEGISVVLYGDIYTKYNIKTEKLVRKTSIENAKIATKIFNGDLLFTASGETKEDIGKCIVFIGKEESVASGDVVIFRQNINDSLFLGYVFNSYNVINQKARLSKGEIVVHIYSSQLRNIHFAIPPLEEQIEIREFIDLKTEEIQNIISKTQQEIELLKEYKTTLISEVVTGKIDVREAILN